MYSLRISGLSGLIFSHSSKAQLLRKTSDYLSFDAFCISSLWKTPRIWACFWPTLNFSSSEYRKDCSRELYGMLFSITICMPSYIHITQVWYKLSKPFFFCTHWKHKYFVILRTQVIYFIFFQKQENYDWIPQDSSSSSASSIIILLSVLCISQRIFFYWQLFLQVILHQ